jgi:hypothetical protein
MGGFTWPMARLGRRQWCHVHRKEAWNLPITMIGGSLNALSCIPSETNLEVSTGAEHIAMSRDHDALDARVVVELREDLHQLPAHGGSKGIALARSVERQDNDGGDGGRGLRVVGELDVLIRSVGIARRK